MRRINSIISHMVLSSVLVGCASDGGQEHDSASFVRPVVLPAQPLSLYNPQQEAVTWPIWGSAFTLDEAVGIRVTMNAGSMSGGGLEIAGPGEVEDRRAIQLMWTGSAWALRETVGGMTVHELAIDAPGSAAFVIELDQDGRSLAVTVDGAGYSVTPGEPLAPDAAAGVYVHLEPGAELAIAELAMTQPLPVAPGLGPPLRELAAGRGIEIGSATDVWPPLHDIGFEALLAQEFDTAAPTEFYWATTRGEDDDYFFVPGDLMVNYAGVHGQTLNGYFLVWDYALPSWVIEVAESGDAAALGMVLDDHIETLVSRYQDRVDAWIVVNEAIWGPNETDGGAMFAESLWSDVLGVEYIEHAFRTARAADPDAILIYNETGAEMLGVKSDFLYQMAADFIARDVPIDAIGLQFHIDAAAPPDMASVKANMERFGALGLAIYITELDVSLASVGGTERDKLDLQAMIYADLLEVCLSVPACRSYTVFGFTDRYAWDELGDAAPLLFDEHYRPKPAFFAVQSMLGTSEAFKTR